MRTRKPNVTEKDFTMIKTLRAGGASTEEIVRLTGFSDSVIYRAYPLDTFEEYLLSNKKHNKSTAEKTADQISVDDMIQPSEKETSELLIDMIAEIGSNLARIADALEKLTGGKKE